MAAYFISNYNVTDADKYQTYVQQVVPLVFKHGGEIVVASHDSKTMEGVNTSHNVVLKFPDEQHASAWYNDPEYQPVKQIRLDCTENGHAFIANEFVMPQG